MISAITKLEDGTIKLTITIPSQKVRQTWDEVVEKLVKEADLPGFRKGKAPKKLIEEKLDKDKVVEEVLKKILPESYVTAVKEHNLKPIVNPKIHLGQLDKDLEKDWQFEAFTCEMPQVSLGDYKQNIQKITAKSKIIIPGKEPQKPSFEEIVKALLESVTLNIPKILIEGEVEKHLAQTLDEVKKLGLSLDQYLHSTGRTPEKLREETEEKVKNDMKLEFTLQKIAEEEKIVVENKEIEEAIQKAKSEEEKKNLENNRYLLAGILKQQKTLDFLSNL